MLGLLACAAPQRPALLRPALPPAPLVPVAQRSPDSPVAWGSEGPLQLRAAGSDGRWLLVCQARADSDGDGQLAVTLSTRGELGGDAVLPFLIEGGGLGQRVDAFVDADPSGRFVAVVVGGALWLRDTQRGESLDLSARGARLAAADGSPAARFDASGQLVYLRAAAGGEQLVVHELASGRERALEPSPGVVASFALEDGWVRVEAWPEALGAAPEPHAPAATPQVACRPPISAYALPEPVPRGARRWIARLNGGPWRDASHAVASLGALGWLRRAADDALLLEGSNVLPAEPWATPACDARLLHSDARRGLVLLACRGERGHARVQLVGAGYRRALGLDVASVALDGVLPGSPRYVALVPRRRSPLLVDLETRETLPLSARDQLLASGEGAVLVRRQGRLWLGDPHAPLRELGPVSPLAPVLRAPPSAFVAPYVVDLERGTLLGRVEATGLGLSRDGAVLVARAPGHMSALPLGPLRWLLPSPPERRGQEAVASAAPARLTP